MMKIMFANAHHSLTLSNVCCCRQFLDLDNIHRVSCLLCNCSVAGRCRLLQASVGQSQSVCWERGQQACHPRPPPTPVTTPVTASMINNIFLSQLLNDRIFGPKTFFNSRYTLDSRHDLHASTESIL